MGKRRGVKAKEPEDLQVHRIVCNCTADEAEAIRKAAGEAESRSPGRWLVDVAMEYLTRNKK